MTALNAFRNVILPFVHDCPDMAADIAARFAIREFCKKSDWLLYEHDPVSVLAGQAEYEFEPPTGTMVVSVIEASLDGRPLEAATREYLTGKYGDWRKHDGTPYFYTQITRDALRLVPTPDAEITSGLKMIVSLEPTVDAVAVDSSIYERWSEIIGYGARARLKDMPGQPYYDPAGAKSCADYFQAGIEQAKLERQKAMTRSVTRVQMRRWV